MSHLFTKMGSEGDLIESANSIQINPRFLWHESLILPLCRMVAHRDALQRVWSA
jgi:hypothetical protein